MLASGCALPVTQPALFAQPARASLDFKGNQLRTVTIDGEPWFVAQDICMILFAKSTARSDGSASRYLKYLSENEKQKVRKNTVAESGGNQRGFPFITLINESGLYKLIMKSLKDDEKQRVDGKPTGNFPGRPSCSL